MKFIELHIHLDGSIRLSTLYELSKTKLSFEIFSKQVSISGRKSFSSLTDCLNIFKNIISIIKGDKKILERIGYEFVEDRYKNNILYTEVRYNPQLLRGNKLTSEEVIDSINKGFEKGMEKYPVYINTILCCIREYPQYCQEVVDLAIKYKNKGIVGIDLAGDESKYDNNLFKKYFDYAHQNDINITIHSGEVGNGNSIISAVNDLHAKRIGHGYTAKDNIDILNMLNDKNIHIECCPSSSLGTCSVNDLQMLKIFDEHHINFSINTDDPSVFGVKYSDEIKILKDKLEISNPMLHLYMINALESAFISKEKKNEIFLKYLGY